MKARNSEVVIIKILIGIIGAIYISFLYMDINNIGMYISSNNLKFISIIVIFIISIFIRKNPISCNDIHILQAGLFITIFADLFLLVLNSHYILGIFLFSIVQILYSIRYDSKSSKSIIRNFIIIFIGLSITYLILNRFIINIDLLWIVAIFYVICLLNSVRSSIRMYKYKTYPEPNRQMILIGMILFLLCDINVGLYNITGSILLTGKFINLLYNISFISMWLFYLPSQVLLSLSGYKFNLQKF